MDSPVYRLEGVIKTGTGETEDFTGPLDLILYLLSKNRMEIKDIQISLILEQYLKWLEQYREVNLEIASEFVHMASHLIYIKTRTLLSIHDEEAQSELEQLIAALEEHQRNERYEKIKAVLQHMEHRYQYGQKLLTKEPEPISIDKGYHYAHDVEELEKIMLAVLARSDGKLPPPVTVFEGIVGREPYPIEEKANEILHGILSGSLTKLRDIFISCQSRTELVASFIAVLELCKARRICLAEENGEYMIGISENTDDIPLDITSERIEFPNRKSVGKESL